MGNFWNININVSIKDYSCWIYLCMLHKNWFLLVYLFLNVKAVLIYFIQQVSQHQTVVRDFKPSNRNATWVYKCNEYRNYWVLINISWICFGFALDLLNIDLLDVGLSDVDWDLLDEELYSFPVNILLVS